ncbi:protein kinase domain-containing protein [Helicobacter sp. 23-1046]
MDKNAGHTILGKYEIIKELSKGEYQTQVLEKIFIIKRILKQPTNEAIYSHLAQDISTISHKNLVNIKIDEDDLYFYTIRECLDSEEYNTLNPQIFKRNYGTDYVRLIECYLQIFEAIKYIHAKGLFHGNISIDNILVNRDNCVFLLDFGKAIFIYRLAVMIKHSTHQNN